MVKKRTERINYLTAEVRTGATHYAMQFIRNHPLDKLQKVVVIPDEKGFVCVSFMFDMKKLYGYTVNVHEGFCVGCSGEGTRGLHDILIEAGFSENIAERVFDISRYEQTELARA